MFLLSNTPLSKPPSKFLLKRIISNGQFWGFADASSWEFWSEDLVIHLATAFSGAGTSIARQQSPSGPSLRVV